jgi:lysyl-tRNA synthetase class 1
MDEYDLFEDIFFGKISEPNDNKRLKINGVYEYINHLHPPADDSSSIHIPYRILIQQANLFNNQIQDSELLLNAIFDRLKKYRLVKDEDLKKKDLINKITLATNWVRDFSDVTEDEDEADDGDTVRPGP